MKPFMFMFLAIIFSLVGCSTVEQSVETYKLQTGEVVFTGLKVPADFKPENVKSAFDGWRGDLPTNFDWRNVKQLSPVENQGQCGSCWAFSSSATFQDVRRLFGQTEDLSEQHLLSCAKPGEWTCNGGFFAHDQHMAPRGGVLASEYPYTGTDSACRSGLTYRGSITRWAYLPGGETPSVSEIKAAIYRFGPVSVGVAADSAFSNYRGGIFQGSGSTQLNHAVNIVGWGVENGQEFFIMRNSWGSSWGENGYMRVAIKNGVAVNGLGAWTNYIIYNQEPPAPNPGPNPDPNPDPDPNPNPDPEPCTPQPVADTGYGDKIQIYVNQRVRLGTRPLPGHRYYWTAEPAFEGGAVPNAPQINFRPFKTKRLTIHASTMCGEKTDSVTVEVVGSMRSTVEPEVTIIEK